MTEKRREPPYEIVNGRSVEVLVQRKSDGFDEKIHGKMRNFSSGGVQIFLPTHPKLSEEMRLRIHVPAAKVKIDATAEVSWIRRSEENQCLIGCSFAAKLSESVLDRLAVGGIIDRRRHPRPVVSVPGIARSEFDADSFPVRITDYSEGGFCMASGRPGTVGGAVSVEIDVADDAVFPISGRVCWQEERDGEYVLGCSLNRVEDFAQLHRLCSASGDDRQTTLPSFRRQTGLTSFLVVMWVFVFVGTTLLGLGAIESWRSRPIKDWLVDTERNSATLAVSSETDSATAGPNHRVDHRETASSTRQ